MSERLPVKKSSRTAALPDRAVPQEAATGGAAAARLRRARWMAAHGQLLGMRTGAGEDVLPRPPSRDCQVVCGDYVQCEFDARHEELRIVAHVSCAGALE